MSDVIIYSQNICWTKSRENRTKIAKYIIKQQPDIVCLQEAVFDYHIKAFNISNYYQSNYKIPYLPNSGGLLTLSKVKPKSTNFIKYHNQGRINSLQLAERFIGKGFLITDFGDFILINTHLVASHSKNKNGQDKSNLSQLVQVLEYITTNKNNKKVIFSNKLC